MRLDSTIRYALRVTLAGVAAFALGQVITVPLHGLWAVLTAVIVSQASVGGSIGASVEYVLGTLAGALYSSVVALLIPHTTLLATAGVLVLSIAPLAYAAGRSKIFRVAPFTAVIVLLLAGEFGHGPLTAAATRLVEVMMGGAIAIIVSLVFLPERAYGRARREAAQALEQLAYALPVLLRGLSAEAEPEAVQRIQDGLGSVVASFEAVVADVRHEQAVSFGARPSIGPLSRTLLRLRHDLVMLGRAAATPLPATLLASLAPHIGALGAALETHVVASAAALREARPPPSAEPLDAALRAYSTEVGRLRKAGVTRGLSENDVEQLFTLGFTLEQLRRNLADLERCVRDWRSV